MKRIIKRMLEALIRAASPVARPLAARFDARITRIIEGALISRMTPAIIQALAVSEHRLERIEGTLARADDSLAALAEEMDLVLNGMSREVFRLQAQVEMLQRSLADQGRIVSGGLSIVDDSCDEAPVRRPAPAERSRVG
jgi:hypothetical protein